MRPVLIGTMMTVLLGLTAAGCSKSDEGELEKAGKEADAALEEAAKEVEDAGEEVGKAIEGFGN